MESDMVPKPQDDRLREWLPYCFASLIFESVRSTIWSSVSARMQQRSFFYFSVGYVLVSGVYFICRCVRNKRNVETNTCWVDQNLVKNGKVQKRNAVGFAAFQCLSFIVMNMAWITIWCAVLANINAGVLTVIWSVTPLGVAFTEYFFFGVRLKVNYIIGMMLIIICAVALSLN